MKKIITLFLISLLALISLSSDGQTAFTKTYNYASAHYYQPNAIVEIPYASSTPHFFITGQTDTLGAGASNIFIYHLNSSMDTLKTKLININADDCTYSMHQTYDGDLLASGYTTTIGLSPQKEGLYLKVDTSLATVWQKTLTFTNYDVVFYSSAPTPNDSGAVFAGYKKNNTGGSTKSSALLVKTKSNGDTLWCKTYSADSGTNNTTIAYSVIQTADLGYLLSGSYLGSDGYSKIWICKTDNNGDTLWTKQIGSNGIINVARCIREERNLNIVITGEANVASTANKTAYLAELDGDGDEIFFYRIYQNMNTNMVIATDSGYYIIAGTYYGSNNDAIVQYCSELGDSLASTQYGGSGKDAGTNIIFDVNLNTFALCGTYQPGGVSYTVAATYLVANLPPVLCPFWYDRAIRLHAISTDYFLEKVFTRDRATGNNNETHNLLQWIKNNHFDKLIIDGLLYHPGSSCATGVNGAGILVDSSRVFIPLLSKFIDSAKRFYNVNQVYATLDENGDQKYGSTDGCKMDIDSIKAYNKDTANKGKIDSYWLDYEYWNTGGAAYCAGCDGTSHCGIIPTINPTNFFDTVNANVRKYTIWGFKQYKSIIGYADSAINSVNVYYASISSTKRMVRLETVIIANFNFNVDSVHHRFKLASLTPKRYAFDTAYGSLEQGLVFAKWLMDTTHHVGSIAMDLTTVDSRTTSAGPQVCTGVHEANGCTAWAPNHFLNNNVDNQPDAYHCLGNDTLSNKFGVLAYIGRQLTLDFLASYSNGVIPICPYFSCENKVFNYTNSMGNYMTADIQTHQNPAHNLCFPDTPRYIPDIHITFMKQYRNSWKESFVQQWSNAPKHLYSDTMFNNVFFFEHAQDSLQPNPWWGGSATTTPNKLTLGSMEWFPINSYPLVLDTVASHGYDTASHVDCLNVNDTVYPTGSQPPFMYMKASRVRDSYQDGWTSCISNHRMKNPNPDKPKVIEPTLNAKMYPNPSDGNFTLLYSFPFGSGEVFITDLTGRIVYDKFITGITGKESINISNLDNGIYYWKIYTGNEILPNGKIIILK